MTDRRRAVDSLSATVRRALDGGVTAVMLREKDLPTGELVRVGRPVAAACREAGALFLVNHDPQAALELEADGVHVGFRSPAPQRVRAVLGERRLVGASTHDLDELAAALASGADYVTFGPVYDTPSKRGVLAPRGEDALAGAVRAAGDVPVLALGGVDASRVGALRATGVAGIAFIGAVFGADDAMRAARQLAVAWENAA